MTTGRSLLVRAAGAGLVVAGVAELAWSTVGYQQQSPLPRLLVTIALGYGLVAAGHLLVLPARAPVAARTPAPAADGTRPDWLLGVRGLAALLVLAMHGPGLLHHDVTWGGSRFAWLVYSPASLGMLIFFGLSGYLMGKGFATGRYAADLAGMRLFLTSRLLRLAPLAAVVALLVIVLQTPQWLVRADLVLRGATFTLSSVQVPGVLVPLWSLSTEWQFYLLVPVLFLAVQAAVRGTLSLVAVSGLVLVVGWAVRVLVWRTHGNSLAAYQYVYQPVYSNLEVFVLGLLGSWWRPVLRRFDPLLCRAWPVLLAAIVLGYSWVDYQAMQLGVIRYQTPFALVVPTVVAVLLVPVLCGAEALTERGWAAVGSRRYRWSREGLAWAGALTYPVYLVHGAVLYGMQQGIGAQPYVVRAVIGLVLVLAVATVLHLTVERSVLAWRRQVVGPPASLPSTTVPRPAVPRSRQDA